MFYNSRGVSFIIALCIAFITTAFLTLVDDVSFNALVVAGILSFSSSYLLISIVMEFLVFKEINRIYDMLNKLKKKDFSFIEEQNQKQHMNPLKKINQEIFSYAALQQREIDELKRMAAFRREFLADVSHELKTPIFAAQGFVHTLLDGAAKDKTVRNKFLKKAAKSLDGLQILVQDLMTLSHLEAGEIKMHFDACDIREISDVVIDQFENKAEKRHISLGYDQDYPEEIAIYADPQRIYQVMTNLVSNAIKYSEDGTRVEIGFQIGKKDITIYVRDHGSGIPPDHIKRIFERFYRVDKSRSKEKGGTGLGLAIVKHIIEAHDSSVTVTSTVGKGSTFSFKLPKFAPEEKSILKEAPSEESATL